MSGWQHSSDHGFASLVYDFFFPKTTILFPVVDKGEKIDLITMEAILVVYLTLLCTI